MPLFPAFAARPRSPFAPRDDRPDPFQQIPQGSPIFVPAKGQRRRGLFGGPARGIVRREDGDPGTLLNYLVFGQGGVEDMRESRMNRDLFGMRSQTWKRQEEDAARERTNTDAAIGTLDPSLQPWARLAPEVAARAALAGLEQPDYQIDAQGRPYTIQNGRVMYGEGQVAVPPRGGAAPISRPLRGPDASLLTRTRETAESSRGLRAMVQDFAQYNARQRTGPGAGANPLNGGVFFDPEIRAMDALANRMRGLMRPSGSGATSDFEQRIYARGAPSIDNTPEQNAAIIRGLERLSDIADARQFFYEDFAEANGTLNGAERAFQQTPEFRQLTNVGGGGGPGLAGIAAAVTTNDGSGPEQPRERIWNRNTGRFE